MRTGHEIRDMHAVLHAVTEASGLATALFSRIEHERWCVRAVLDGAGFGITAGNVHPVSDVLCGRVHESGAPLVVTDLEHHEQFKTHPTFVLFGARAYVGVPVQFDDGTSVGTLCALSKRAEPHAGRALPLMALLAQLIAHELQLADQARSTETRLEREQLNAEDRERFLALVAHDLRNPLSAIRLNAEMLARQPTPETRSPAERILAVTARMSRLIDDLLDLSRGRLGAGIAIRRVHLEPRPFLAARLHEIVVANPQAQIETELDELVPYTDAWDGDRVAQLLDNVIGNAIQHGNDEPVHVRARLVDGAVEIDVVNGGAAIPDDVLETLFEPFHRSKAPARGLGLGLYIAYQIALAHGGNIDAKTRDGKTCMRTTLPV